MELDLWSIERAHYAQGCKVICGVDEAGRGPLAGPVCAAAVISEQKTTHRTAMQNMARFIRSGWCAP